MPTKNIVKYYNNDCYYHVYNRGVNKEKIFGEPSDYFYMIGLFKRHLSKKQAFDSYKRALPHYINHIDLVAFCLMPNHYHLLVFLKEKDGLEKLMRSVMTAYSMYYNKKYRRVGSLFQNHFLASNITDNEYLWHVSRYIHLNPLDINEDPLKYPYSSIDYFLHNKKAEWLHPEWLIENKKESQNYKTFVKDYEALHKELGVIKRALANALN